MSSLQVKSIGLCFTDKRLHDRELRVDDCSLMCRGGGDAALHKTTLLSAVAFHGDDIQDKALNIVEGLEGSAVIRDVSDRRVSHITQSLAATYPSYLTIEQSSGRGR